uniref:Uncharacterized protein n=1 Tax=Zea mays TaxID=4577 RepID=A0A804UKS9_MAIZE
MVHVTFNFIAAGSLSNGSANSLTHHATFRRQQQQNNPRCFESSFPSLPPSPALPTTPAAQAAARDLFLPNQNFIFAPPSNVVVMSARTVARPLKQEHRRPVGAGWSDILSFVCRLQLELHPLLSWTSSPCSSRHDAGSRPELLPPRTILSSLCQLQLELHPLPTSDTVPQFHFTCHSHGHDVSNTLSLHCTDEVCKLQEQRLQQEWEGILRLELINQRANFAFALFSEYFSVGPEGRINRHRVPSVGYRDCGVGGWDQRLCVPSLEASSVFTICAAEARASPPSMSWHSRSVHQSHRQEPYPQSCHVFPAELHTFMSPPPPPPNDAG